MATTDPSKIEEKDTNIIICDQLDIKLSNGTYKTLIKIIIAAIFGTDAKNDVTAKLHAENSYDNIAKPKLKMQQHEGFHNLQYYMQQKSFDFLFYVFYLFL